MEKVKEGEITVSLQRPLVEGGEESQPCTGERNSHAREKNTGVEGDNAQVLTLMVMRELVMQLEVMERAAWS